MTPPAVVASLAVILAGLTALACRRCTRRVAAVMAMCLCATAAYADSEPVRWSVQQWTATIIKPGENQSLAFGARASVDYALRGVHFVGRIDGSALPGADGTAPAVSLSDLTTVQAIEGYAGVWRKLGNTPVALTAIYGEQRTVDHGVIGLGQGAAHTTAAGLLIGDGKGNAWALAMIGHHEAAGPGLKCLFTGQFPLGGRVSIVADGAFGRTGSFLRIGPAVRVGGQ